MDCPGEDKTRLPTLAMRRPRTRLLFAALVVSTFLAFALLFTTISNVPVKNFYILPPMLVTNNASGKTNLTSASDQADVAIKRKPFQTSTTTKKKAQKVLIVAYFRSGSTFFSEMFNYNPSAFYMFEPLVFYLLPGNKTLTMLNGQNRTVEEMMRMTNVVRMLDDILNCRLTSLPIWYLKHSFLTKSQRFFRYLRCLVPVGGRIRHSMEYCVQGLVHICKTSKLRIIKLIRFGITVKNAKMLKKLNPEVKFVHLVRDPRGSVLSQFDAMPPESAYVGYKKIAGYCDKIERDLDAIKQLKNSSSIDILTVNYEDLAENPTTAASAVYSFLGLNLPGRVISVVNRLSSAKHNIGYKFGTERRNSTQTAYAWKHKIKFDLVKTVDSYCSKVYPQLGYLPISSRKELADPDNKHRVLLKLVGT